MTTDPDDRENYRTVIAINLHALRHRLREALMRAEAACESHALRDPNIAMGALSSLDVLLAEASALHQSALVLHRSYHLASRALAHGSTETPVSASRSGPTSRQSVHREIDELAGLNVITPERANLLKEQLTDAAIQQHLLAGMSISELIDLYNDLAAAEQSLCAR